MTVRLKPGSFVPFEITGPTPGESHLELAEGEGGLSGGR